MKSTTMLSQITTQEDVLFAGITVKQLGVWMVGAIALVAIYALVPHPMRLGLVKGSMMLLIALISLISTIRYQGSLLLDRWILWLQYILRPSIVTE
jgi:hypothetical protein